MTDEMLVEAVARVLDTYAVGKTNASGDMEWFVHLVVSGAPRGDQIIARYNNRTDAYLHCRRLNAECALSALPPEMRAAGEMKRALARYMNAVSDLHGHFDWESGYGRTRGPVDEEFDAATEEARAALALASSPGQQSTKDGEEE